MEVIWHGQRDWGTETFRVDGVLYRWAKREDAVHLTIETSVGEARLHRMSQSEIRSLETPTPQRTGRRRRS